MGKKIYQIITILFIIFILVGIPYKSIAATIEGGGGVIRISSSITIDDIWKNAKSFIDEGVGDNKFQEDAIENMIKSIYKILLVIGIIAVVIVGILLSIQFITGGLEEQAKVKEMLVPYIVGSVVIFTAFTIWKIVVDILQTVQKA